MTKITEKEAIEIISEKGFIKRFKGYDMVIYKKVDAKTWRSFAKVRCSGGFVNSGKLQAALSLA